jgi:hypothetical protein
MYFQRCILALRYLKLLSLANNGELVKNAAKISIKCNNSSNFHPLIYKQMLNRDNNLYDIYLIYVEKYFDKIQVLFCYYLQNK